MVREDGDCSDVLAIQTNLRDHIWFYSYDGYVADSVPWQFHYLYWNIKSLVDSFHKNMVALALL